MNLTKVKRVRLKGKAAKEFYNAVYERDGGTLKMQPKGKRYAVNIFKAYTVTREQRENEPVEMDQNRRQICLK